MAVKDTKYHGWKWNPSTSALEVYVGTTKVAAFTASTASIVPNVTVTGSMTSAGTVWSPATGVAFSKATKVAKTSGATVTYSAADLLAGYIEDTVSTGCTLTLPLATDIIAAVLAATGDSSVGVQFDFTIVNLSGGANTITVTTNTGITLYNAAATIAQNKAAIYRCIITAATTVICLRIADAA